MLVWLGACLLMYLLPLLHELGHAVVGSLLHMRVEGIIVGGGREVLRTRFVGLSVSICVRPLQGLANVYPRGHRLLCARQFFMVLAGPAVDLSVLAVVPIMDVHFGLPSYPTSTATHGISMLLYAIFVFEAQFLIYGLWPREYYRGGRKRWTDGYWLWTILFSHKTVHIALQSSTADFHCRQGNFSKARDLYRQMLHEKDLKTEERTHILDAVACLPIFYDCPQFLNEADECSMQALEISPSSLTLKGTRGSILIYLGRIAEGRALLEEVWKQSPSDVDRAICACHLALASSLEGDTNRTDKMIALGRNIDPHCRVLDKVFKEIEEARRNRNQNS